MCARGAISVMLAEIAGHVMRAGDVDEAGASPRGHLIRRTARDLHGRPVDVAVLPACGYSETDEFGSCLETIEEAPRSVGSGGEDML